MHNRKPAILFLIFTVAIFTGLTAIFSWEKTKGFFEGNGLYFYSYDYKEKQSTPIVSTAQTDSSSRIKNVDSLKSNIEGSPSYASAMDIHKSKRSVVPDSFRLMYDSLIKTIKYLHYSDGGNGSLENFFNRLSKSNKSGKLQNLLRIWYYGDSQIEGDRITREIRKLLQNKFGGYGFGYVPLSNPATYMHLELGKQNDFQKLSCFQHRRKHKDFGVSGLAFAPNNEYTNGDWLEMYLNIHKWLPYRFLELSMKLDSTAVVEWKQVSDSMWKAATTKRWNHLVRVFSIGDTTLRGQIQIRIKGVNPVIYGLNFQGSSRGIVIDNYGIRGHSGDGLRSISSDLLREEAKSDKLGLVVFHYGNNMVPYIKNDEKTKKWVQGIFRGLFSKYKKACPTSSFLVIGPGSMGKKEGDESMEYESCSILNGWMQEVATDQGFAYFDFYRFMVDAGGILSWREKGLASLDGHLSVGGQKQLAKTLTTSVLNAYKAFELTLEK